MKSVKEKLRASELTIGSWITFGHTAIAEIMARAGFDWLTVDMEHSAIGLQEAQRLIQVIELCGVTPLVRVGENAPLLIKRVMDAGAHGVIVPMINTRDDAIRAVEAVKYPPIGKRGVGLARAHGYGLEFEKYRKWVNKGSIVVVQIEHIDAINNLEDILKVEGVDASILGPYDLSASLGHPGEFERNEIKELVCRYIKLCDKLKKPAGFHVIPPKSSSVKEKLRQGFNFIGFSVDMLFLGRSIKDNLSDLKSAK